MYYRSGGSYTAIKVLRWSFPHGSKLNNFHNVHSSEFPKVHFWPTLPGAGSTSLINRRDLATTGRASAPQTVGKDYRSLASGPTNYRRTTYRSPLFTPLHSLRFSLKVMMCLPGVHAGACGTTDTKGRCAQRAYNMFLPKNMLHAHCAHLPLVCVAMHRP